MVRLPTATLTYTYRTSTPYTPLQHQYLHKAYTNIATSKHRYNLMAYFCL